MKVRAHVNNTWLHTSMHNHRNIWWCLQGNLCNCAIVTEILFRLGPQSDKFCWSFLSFGFFQEPFWQHAFRLPEPCFSLGFQVLVFCPKVPAAQVDFMMSQELSEWSLQCWKSLCKHKPQDWKMCVQHSFTQYLLLYWVVLMLCIRLHD